MTPQEAIELFQTVTIQVPKDKSNKYYKAIMLAEKALEKQILKKPLKAYGGAYRCPNCQIKHFDYDWVGTKYCDCGQALDWGDEE